MRVALTGATGLIGGAVVPALLGRGDSVVVLTRDPDRARSALGERVELIRWIEPERSPPPAGLAGTDAVINLLGEPIAQRWSPAVKREIHDSRVLGTRSLIAGLAALADGERPKILISQSATGYYGPRADEAIDESPRPGNDFVAGVVVDWEHEAEQAPAGIRVALTRTGVVLAPHGGALAKMLPPFRLGLGGPVGGGRQYVPWIHVGDVAGALLRCLDDEGAVGPVNVTAPNPVTNAELSRALGRALHRPAVLPVPGAAVRALYGEMATIVLTGQRVLPARLLELGYEFRFPELEPALRDVLRRAPE